jgi:hypothetical protein
VHESSCHDGQAGPGGAQNTHGESNPEHFSVKSAPPNNGPGGCYALPAISELPFKAPAVLFRYILTAELMQKIHRLTDN